MGDDSKEPQHRRLNYLTVIKLALQMLERKTELSEQQRGLARAALEATDGLAADLLQARRAERGSAAAGRDLMSEPATARRMWTTQEPGGWPVLRRGFRLRPAGAVGLLVGMTLLLFILLGAAVLLQLFWLLLLLGTVAWLSRR